MRYDVMTPIKTAPNKKTRWHRIGRAFSARSGGKAAITVILDSVPFRSEFLYLYESKDQDGGPISPEVPDGFDPSHFED